jgi:hypothetical protein
VLGREVEDDAMVSRAQKRFAGCLGSKHAGLTFDAEVAVEAAPTTSAIPMDIGFMMCSILRMPLSYIGHRRSEL